MFEFLMLLCCYFNIIPSFSPPLAHPVSPPMARFRSVSRVTFVDVDNEGDMAEALLEFIM